MKWDLISIVVAMICILGIAGWFWHVSGQYDQEPVYGLRAPTTFIDIERDTPLVVPFSYAGHQIAGVILYTDDATTLSADVDVTIQDASGEVLASKRRQVVYYPQSGQPTIHVFLSSATYKAGQSLRLAITSKSGQSLRLLANEAIEGESSPQLVFSLLSSRPVSSGARQGVLIGTVVAMVLLLLYYARFERPSYQWIAAVTIVGLAAGLTSLPFIYRLDAWGINDWDYRHSLTHIYSTALRDYHQVPLWNPYMCGGAAALGDPEFALFTPSFVAQYLLGVENGTGIALAGGLFVTGVGMLLLAGLLGQSPVPASVAALTVIGSSALLLKMTEGHVTIIWAYMWVPWMLAAWVQAYRMRGKQSARYHIWTFLTGVCLTLMLLQGGIYILSYTILSFLGLIICSRRHWQALTVTVFAGVWMLGLSAFQLLPSLYWMREFPDKTFVGSTYTWDRFPDIFLGRHMHGTFILHNQLSNWHEYGAYVGWGVLLLAVMSVGVWKTSKIVRVLFVGVVVTIIVSSLGPLLAPLLSHLPFLPRSNISRVVLFSVLYLGLLAGFGLSYALRRWPRYAAVPLVVIGFVAIDLMSLAYPIAEQGFVIPRVYRSLPPVSSPILHTNETHTIRHSGFDMPRAYGATLQGYGTSSFCAVLGPDAAVSVVSSDTPTPAYLAAHPPHDVRLLSWSPNVIVFSYSSPEVFDVALNTNYAAGWQTSYGDIQRELKRLTVRVPAGEDKEVRVYYRPPGMYVGMLLSVGTVLVAAGLYIFRRRIF